MQVKHEGIERKTAKAVLLTVQTENGKEAVWFPLSRCSVTGSHVDVPNWLARKKKLVEAAPVKSFEEMLALTGEDEGNEAEAQLVRDEIAADKMSQMLELLKEMSEETGMSKAEILFNMARAA